MCMYVSVYVYAAIHNKKGMVTELLRLVKYAFNKNMKYSET
jgi:hypothetical protein